MTPSPQSDDVGGCLACSAGIRLWQTQLGAAVHGLARVCATRVAERVFSAILSRSVLTLAAHYLTLSPAPAWLPRYSADCQTILATVLSYSEKLPTVATHPARFAPRPCLSASSPTL